MFCCFCGVLASTSMWSVRLPVMLMQGAPNMIIYFCGMYVRYLEIYFEYGLLAKKISIEREETWVTFDF